MIWRPIYLSVCMSLFLVTATAFHTPRAHTPVSALTAQHHDHVPCSPLPSAATVPLMAGRIVVK